MAKIVKHTFKNMESLKVDDKGDLIVEKREDVTLHFSMLHKGHEIFQSLYGIPLFSALIGSGVDVEKGIIDETAFANTAMGKMLDPKFILCLAAASYIDVSNGTIVNSSLSAQEFIDMNMESVICTDMEFINKLMELIEDSDMNSKKKQKNTGGKKPRKKQ